MNIRMAKVTDAIELLQIYGQYINTKTTFEDHLPTEKEFENRILDTLQTYPYLVYEDENHVIGYSYAHKFKERAAYQWCAELSIYIDQQYLSKGLGKNLYKTLIRILQFQGIKMVYGGITVPNEKSENLHTSLGFIPVGTYHNAGYKCNKWHDVIWYELRIGELEENPKKIIPLSNIPNDVLNRLLTNS